MRAWLGIAFMLLVGACEPEPLKSLAPLYDTAPIETRTIEVTVEASGVIEPEITVEVKSKASGEILAMHAETGDVVDAGSLLVEIDQRTPRNRFAEAEEWMLMRLQRPLADSCMTTCSRTIWYRGGCIAQNRIHGITLAIEFGTS